MILADTNILLHNFYALDPQYPATERALTMLRRRDEVLCIAPQNLVEFWAVATRPLSDNGLGIDTATATREIASAQSLFHLLLYTPDVISAWQHLVSTHGISGKQTHDAHIVAMMQVHSVQSILTFNYKHFSRFSGITVLNPAKL